MPRNQMRHLGAALGLSAVSVVIAGCGAARTHLTNIGSDSSGSTTLQAPIAYPSAGITLTSPPSSASATATASTALGTCSTGESPCDTGSPDIVLATMSNSEMGAEQVDNSVQPTYQNVLVWVMTWHDVNCETLGPAQSAVPRTPMSDCDHIVFVDASSGHYLYAYTGPPASS